MKKLLLVISIVVIVFGALAVILCIPSQPKVNNQAPANSIITKDYDLEQLFLLDAIFDVRDGFCNVKATRLADDVDIKLECKRQIAPDLFYYIVQGRSRRCFIFTDTEDTVKNIIATYEFATLNEIKKIETDLNTLYPVPVQISHVNEYSLDTTAYLCMYSAKLTYYCIPLQDGIVIEEQPTIPDGTKPIYYYYTYEEWPVANATWQQKYESWSCPYEILPIDLIWNEK